MKGMEQRNSSIEIYRSPEGNIELNVKLENDTVWLTQSQMAELFAVDRTSVTRHIRNIYKSQELDEKSTCAKNAQVRLMSRAITLQDQVSEGEYNGLFNVISDYVYALDTLDKYDYQTLLIDKTTQAEPFHATYENAMEAINALKEKFGGSKWFANEKDDSFKSSIGQIYQTFGGEELYASVEEKAAMLLYLVVKNHSFSDGNKRIAAMLFLWFMEKNGILYAENGHKRIADNTLVALTLMIAESRTEEKDVMVKVVVNLINKDNQ